MQPEIRTDPVDYVISGHSLKHDLTKQFGNEIITLLGRVWPVIKTENLRHDGINRVVYDGEGMIFAGVVLNGAANSAVAVGLERKAVCLTRYAYWKHVGPYRYLPVVGLSMRKKLEANGVCPSWPMIEVYGHWTNDENKLETETFLAIDGNNDCPVPALSK